MPESLRALLFILLLSAFGFYLIKKQVYNNYENIYNLLRRYWYTFTILAFLAHSYLIFAIFSIPLLFRESIKLKLEYSIPLFFLLLLTLPTLPYFVPGIGGINYILEINWPRLLVIFYLLIIYLTNNNSTKPIVKIDTDKYIFLFVLYISVLSFRDTTFTDALRQIVYNILDIYIPYMVISRLTVNLETLKNVFFAIYVAIFIMSVIAMFETVKSWHLYTPLNYSLEIPVGNITDYKYRIGLLRAYSAFGAIPLGLLIIVTLTICLYLFKTLNAKYDHRIYYLILIGGLFSTLSRAPWVALLLIIGLHILLEKNNIIQWIKLLTLSLIIFAMFSFSNFGKKVINILPIIGSDSSETISYREKLLNTSLDVIIKNPFFGSTDYYNDPLMHSLIQGEGIIDIVNTYLQISLEYGLIGLFLFITIFASVLVKIYKLKKLYVNTINKNTVSIANVFLISITSIMFVIFTVSTLGVSTISIFYWSYIGLAIGYIRLCNKNLSNRNETTFQ